MDCSLNTGTTTDFDAKFRVLNTGGRSTLGDPATSGELVPNTEHNWGLGSPGIFELHARRDQSHTKTGNGTASLARRHRRGWVAPEGVGGAGENRWLSSHRLNYRRNFYPC